MSADVRGQLGQLELMMLTRHQDYQELSGKINLVNRQLNAKLDSVVERLADLHQKITSITNKLNMAAK
jgi:phage shock protein A